MLLLPAPTLYIDENRPSFATTVVHCWSGSWQRCGLPTAAIGLAGDAAVGSTRLPSNPCRVWRPPLVMVLSPLEVTGRRRQPPPLCPPACTFVFDFPLCSCLFWVCAWCRSAARTITWSRRDTPSFPSRCSHCHTLNSSFFHCKLIHRYVQLIVF
jgi:hypothetical protein